MDFQHITLLIIFLGSMLLSACKHDPVVETEYGKIKGLVDKPHRTLVWRGIPYAQPPLGPLRWKAPSRAAPWPGILHTDQFSAPCPQLGSMYGPAEDGYSQDISLQETFDQPIGSEDCLYMNIWRPLNKRTKLPVIVYLHGGSHIYGAGSLYSGVKIAQQGAVYVSLNYRLGLFGWLHHPALKTARHEDRLSNTGNFGTLDIIQALRFIQNNIGAFGGDATNITVIGQSAGASHVFSLLVSPLAEGLLHKAVMLSPGLLNQNPDTALTYAQGLLQTLVILNGLASDTESARLYLANQDDDWVRAFLHSQSQTTLLTATSLVPQLRIAPAILLEGVVQPEDPYSAIASGQFNNVPVMMGITSEEGKLFTQNGMIIDNATLWSLIHTFNPNAPDTTPVMLEDIIAANLLPVERPQHGQCGNDNFISGGYNDFANRCGALAPTALFQQLQNTVLLPLIASQQQAVFAYEWAWNQQPHPWDIIHGSVHGGDIDFILGLFGSTIFSAGYSDDNRAGRADLALAMNRALLAFARTGNPNHNALGDVWLPWSVLPGQPKRLLLDADDQQKSVSMQY